MGAVKNHFHDEICASDEPDFPEPYCLTCMDRGVVGGCTGQTPENMDWVTEPCPDCTPTTAAETVSVGTARSDVHPDTPATGGVQKDQPGEVR